MVLVNSGFSHAKKFAVWTRGVKIVGQPCSRPKKFKQYGFKGRQIIGFSGARTFFTFRSKENN
jgi:hypothetical protein